MLLQLASGIGLNETGDIYLPEQAFLPPLLVLMMNEFGMLACLIGSIIAVKMFSGPSKPVTNVLLLITNLVLAGCFAYIGYELAVQTGVIDLIMNGQA